MKTSLLPEGSCNPGGHFHTSPSSHLRWAIPQQPSQGLPRKQCFLRPSLPCVPTRASARPPRPSPLRELSCPWRRLTAWKLFSSSRLKTKMTASAQPENLRGVREQKGGQTSLLLWTLCPGRSGKLEFSPLASADPSQPAHPNITPHLGIRCPSFLSDQHQMSLSIHQHLFLVLVTCPEGVEVVVGQRSQVTKFAHAPCTLAIVASSFLLVSIAA